MTDELLLQLKTEDRDRYLSLLFAPEPARSRLAALYAFNLELEHVQWRVSEVQIGAIRLQWWRETLDKLFAGQEMEHPVARRLAAVVASSGIPAEGLNALVDACELALFRETPATLEDLERYLGQSSSMLMQLAVLVLGGSAPETAGLAGVAYGLARLLHGSPRWFVPADMRDELGDEVAMHALVGQARRRLLEARKTQFASDLLPAFLPAAVTPVYLNAVAADPAAPARVSPLRTQLNIWWAARRNRF